MVTGILQKCKTADGRQCLDGRRRHAIQARASDAASLTTMEEATEHACSMLPITSGGEQEWTTQQLISNNSLQAPAAPLPPRLAGMMTSCYNKDTVVLPGSVSKPANLHGIHCYALSSRSAETDHSTEGWTQEETRTPSKGMVKPSQRHSTAKRKRYFQGGPPSYPPTTMAARAWQF